MLEQLEAAGGVLDHHGRRAMAKRCGHRRLTSRLDVHGAQRQRLAPLRERAGCRRQALSLGKRPLDRDRTRLCKTRLLGEGVAVPLDDGRSQALQQVRRCFAAHLDALAGAAEAVESPGRAFLPSGHRGQLSLGALALDEQGIEP